MSWAGMRVSEPRGPLNDLARIAGELGAVEIARDARSVAGRLASGLFHVAFVGQFKRGKSTLINALIGEAILPVGVVPVTAVITIVRHGAVTRARVRLADGSEQDVARDQIADYVAEDRNPGNRKGVEVIIIETPNTTLASGMCLVDTPGLGSVFGANTETTRRFLPHVDAAVVVLGADPPISGEEVSLVKELAGQVPEIVFVLNKADRLPEGDVAAANSFCTRILRNTLQRDVDIFTLSAVDWSRPAIARDRTRFEQRLTSLAAESGAGLVHASEMRAVRRLGARLLHEIDERRAALVRPLEENDARLAALRVAAADAERSLRELSFLFMAEERHLDGSFRAERDRFLAAVTSAATEQLRTEIFASDQRGQALRNFALHQAQRIAEQRVRAWLADFEPRAETMYANAAGRLTELAHGFARRLGEQSFADLHDRIDFDQGFRTRRRFFFTNLSGLTGRVPGASVLDAFRRHSRFQQSVTRGAETFLLRLLESNSARVVNDLIDRVVESRRALEAEIRRQLENAVSSAEAAASRARVAKGEGEILVRAAADRLDAARTKVASIASSVDAVSARL